MTLVETDEFFREHPLKESYFKYSENERSGILAVAARDIQAAVSGIEPVNGDEKNFIDAAIAEQTIFLMLNPEYLTGKYTRTAAVGSGESMLRFSDQLSPLGQRAAALIAPLLKRGENLKEKTTDATDILPPTVSLMRG